MATSDDPRGGTGLARAFGIEPGSKVAVVNEPEGWLDRLDPLPPGARLFDRASEPLDVIVYFSDERANVVRRLPVFAGFLRPGGALWMCTPAASPDLTEAAVTAIGTGSGLSPDGTLEPAPGWIARRFTWS
jgi:hypothetical protein